MILFRRFLVMTALLFWQGGFLFYASVVVPVAQKELATPQEPDSHRRQGFVTRRVTNFLNLSGAIALAILALELMSADHKRWRRLARAILWLGMAAALALLVWLHIHLDSMLDPDQRLILDREQFYASHRAYLWISTVQWAFGVVFLWLTLAAWRAADQPSVSTDMMRNGTGK
jgi:uncharacterized membrane protein